MVAVENLRSSVLTPVVSQLVWTWSAGGKPNNYNARSNQLTIEWDTEAQRAQWHEWQRISEGVPGTSAAVESAVIVSAISQRSA